MKLALIVEGHGEVQAAPILVRRICQELAPSLNLEVLHPHRVSRSKVVKQGELERAVELSARHLGTIGPILVILDADRDPPCQLGPVLLERAQRVRPGWPMAVVMAKREFESWFLAGVASLRGSRTLSASAEVLADPETERGAKEWLDSRMERGYAETLDQAAFAQRLGIAETRTRSRSFDKLVRDVHRLIWSA